MEQEKEVRYGVSKKQIQDIIAKTEPYQAKKEMLDITLGYEGFDSYAKYGFICRVRQKDDQKVLEVKNYKSFHECIEQSIKLESVMDGVNYLRLIGMKPYLYLKREREVRKYKNLKIFIDEFDILGDFVEIEYQDSPDSEGEMKDFMELIGISGPEQDMYGGIVKNKLETDSAFKELFEQKLSEILNCE